jgi:hypothetical protein
MGMVNQRGNFQAIDQTLSYLDWKTATGLLIALYVEWHVENVYNFLYFVA